MKLNLIIVDHFYHDPDEVRSVALRSEFSERGNYPGQRTEPFLNDEITSTIPKLIGESILDWEEDIANGSFQYTTCRDRSWIHADSYNEWAGVLYLSPNAPSSGGTAFYKHIATGFCYYPADENLGEKCDRDAQDYTKWERLDTVANVYNRLILFNAKRFHASQDYFGHDLNDGRLFQTFFFNTVRAAQAPKRLGTTSK